MAAAGKKNPTIVATIVASSVGVIRTNLRQCSIAAFALLIAPLPAAAQTVCSSHADMASALIEDYGEALRGGGVAGPQAVFEVWASDSTGSWTILQISPSGIACVRAAGNGWWDTRPPAGAPIELRMPHGPGGEAVPGRGASTSLSLAPVKSARAPRPGPHQTAARPFFPGGAG